MTLVSSGLTEGLRQHTMVTLVKAHKVLKQPISLGHTFGPFAVWAYWDDVSLFRVFGMVQGLAHSSRNGWTRAAMERSMLCRSQYMI
jgi:hypothetical protein